MKHFHSFLPSGLLLAYSIYSAFIQINIAHSIILLALAGLYCFHQFLLQQKTTSNEKFAQFKMEMEIDLASYKEACNARFSRFEDEVGKLQLNQMPAKSTSSSSNPSPRKMVF